MAYILAVCNQKGGVGKTTTSVNLAASLAAAERKTLLVDMDPQGNSGSGVSIDKRALEKSVYEVLIGECSLQDALVKTELDHLHVLPSNVNLVGAELELSGNVSRETILLRTLQKVSDQYDVVVIDCPPSLNLLTINAMTAANGVLIPVQCEYYALEGMTDLMQTVELVRQGLNPKLDVLGILLTMFDVRNNLSHQVVSELQTHFGSNVFQSIIPRNVRLSEAPSHGKPIILYDIKSVGASRYLELAQEVMARIDRWTLTQKGIDHAAASEAGIGARIGVAYSDQTASIGASSRSGASVRGG